MPRALWLPQVLRAAGLTVHEVDGWQTRGSETFDPAGLICHATASSRTATDAAEIRVLLTGSATAPAPIAQLYLGRQGHWWVVASGRCNHALTGWAGPLAGLGNSRLIGIEASNDNRGEPWPQVQYESYARGVAAILRHLHWTTARVAGHKEHQPPAPGRTSIKTDPTFDMGRFRARVQQYLDGQVQEEEEEGKMKVILIQALPQLRDQLGGDVWVSNWVERTVVPPHAVGGAAWQHQANGIGDGIVHEVDNLDAFGRPAGGPAPVVLTEQDRAAIVADLAVALAPAIEQAAFAGAQRAEDE